LCSEKYLSLKAKWAHFSTDQQVAGASQLSKGPPHGCGEKKNVPGEGFEKRLTVDVFSVSKSNISDSGHKNDAQLTMLIKLVMQ
jgi:hypothetical protein